MRVVRILFGVAFFVASCAAYELFELSAAANTKLDLQERSRRSFDVGWLLRNLLLNSATASDLKSNVTRTIAASKLQPPPPTTRRPRTTRPPTTPAPPPPPPPPFNPFFNKFALFASSSDLWNPTMRPTTTTTTTTTTEAPETTPPPPPPPSRRPRPRPKPYPRPPGFNRPPYPYDYDSFYPSGFDGSLSRGNPRFGPLDYDYNDASTAQSAPPPPPPAPPSAPRKAARNRQRPAAPPPAPTQPAPPPMPQIRRRPAAASAAPPPPPTRSRPPASAPVPPQPQRDRLLYQYAPRDDTFYNESNDDVAGPPEDAPEADIPTEEEDDNSNAAPASADATNGVVGDENEIPESDDDVGPPPEVLSPSFGRRPNARPPPSSPFASPSYYDAIPSSPYNSGSFNAGSGFSSSSFGFNRASPAKGAYQFRDAFSDFQTSYDGGHFQPSSFGSYK